MTKQETKTKQAQLVSNVNYLFIQINQFLIRKLEWLNCLKHCIPVTIVNVRYKTIHRIDSVERYTSLLLSNRNIIHTCHPAQLWMDSSYLDPHLVHVPWTHLSLSTKWHLDRFSGFCTAHPCEHHTDHTTGNICSNRSHPYTAMHAHDAV